MTASTLDHLTQRLLNWYETQSWTAELDALARVVLAELGRGEPVAAGRIAALTGKRVSDVLSMLRGSPAEWDTDGRLVDFGLTLRPTRHRFARVESPCFASGEAIRIDVGPERVRGAEPAEAVVSIVSPAANLSDFRRALCHEQHFFRSPHAASQWQAAHPEGIVVSVADAFTLTRRLFARWIRPAHQGGDGPILDAA